ncbi:MAG: TrkA C-terminal domain-containing protein [Planctomycetota bacterium]
MIGTGSLIALLAVATFALVSVRVAAMALRLTGMSRDASNFQAISAFFGVGFTTQEAEAVVNHPVRRRIVARLIVIGNLGIASGIGAIISTIVSVDSAYDGAVTLGTAAVAIGVLVLVWKLGVVEQLVDRSVTRALQRFGAERPTDYELSLRVHKGFAVAQVEVPAGCGLCGRPIIETHLAEHGVLVLGIERQDGGYVGSPDALTKIEGGDRLTVYGQDASIRELGEQVGPRAARTTENDPPRPGPPAAWGINPDGSESFRTVRSEPRPDLPLEQAP